MNIKTIAAAVFFSLASTLLFAQNIKDEFIEYTYIKKPLMPIDKEVQHYICTIKSAYLDENNRKREEYANAKKTAQENYQKEMVAYEANLKTAQENYKIALDDYNKKSLGKKVLENQLTGENNKPVMHEPRKPYLAHVTAPTLKKEYDTSVIASTYIQLEGYQRLNDNPLKIDVTLYGFDCTQPRVISVQKNLTKSEGGKMVSYTKTYYYIEYSYRHPMAVKVSMPGGKELLNVTPQELNSYAIYKSAETETYPTLNAPLLLASSEEEILQKNLKFINQLVNDKFGYPLTVRKSKLYYVKSKKGDYDDLLMAYNESTSGLTLLTQEPETAKTKVTHAIQLWKDALGQSDVHDKKAHIDKDVTIAICFNLLENYFAMENYAEGQGVLEKLSVIDLASSERTQKMEMEKLYSDLKIRIQTK